jgi:hypothetical protein
MTEKIPFPQIPRIDEEKKMDGAPQSAEDSLFLTVPELARTANTVDDFNKANSGESIKILAKISCEFLQDPQKMTDVFDSLHLLEEIKGSRRFELENKLLARMEKIGSSSAMTPEVAEKWLEISCESSLYGGLADKVIKNTISKCKDQTSLVNFFYNFALAGLKSENEKVLKKTVEILSFKSDMLDPNSKQGLDFMLANFDPTDEVKLKKVMEIDAVLDWQTSRNFPDVFEFKRETIDKMMETKEFQDFLAQILQKDRAKCMKLAGFYDRHRGSGPGISEIKEELLADFPYNMIMNNPGPLREWQNDKVAVDSPFDEKEEKTLNLHVPGHEGLSKVYEDIALSIAEMIKTADKGQGDLIQEKYWQTLSLMVPPEARNKEAQDELRKLNLETKEDMKHNSRTLLSPRGDEIKITDDLLKKYGLDSILYEMNPADKKETIVTLNISGSKYKIILDEYLSLRNFNHRESMNLSDESAFIKNVILSHLREIMCSDKVFEIKTGGKGKENGETARKKFTSRRPHKRELPEGHNPTKEQIAIILQDYGRDIVQMNKERELRGESRKVTYVYEVDNVAIPVKKPMKSSAPEATKKLKEILKNNHNNHEVKEKS